MRLSKQQDEELEINLTSLIDVVFLLLLFFMVSTSFEHATALHIDLPEASAVSTDEPTPEKLEFAIDLEGRMFLNDQQLFDSRPETIRAALSEAAGSERSLPVVIRADAETPHHFVVTAMDVIGQLGFTRLSIATERIAEPE